MRVNVNVDTAIDLKNHGVTMKKYKIVVEEQGAREPKPKTKCQTKVINKKARKL